MCTRYIQCFSVWYKTILGISEWTFAFLCSCLSYSAHRIVPPSAHAPRPASLTVLNVPLARGQLDVKGMRARNRTNLECSNSPDGLDLHWEDQSQCFCLANQRDHARRRCLWMSVSKDHVLSSWINGSDAYIVLGLRTLHLLPILCCSRRRSPGSSPFQS